MNVVDSNGVGGPSPRGRGNPVMDAGSALHKRAIPAWAGEPWEKCGALNGIRGHPRVGGGTLAVVNIEGGAQGPSPRGRGNLNSGGLGIHLAGAIPAWAGEPLVDRGLLLFSYQRTDEFCNTAERSIYLNITSHV
jgi:hypothetical protein